MNGEGILKTSLLVLLLAIFGLNEGYSQKWKFRRYEIGAGIGTMQMFADIGGTASEKNWFGIKDINISETNLTLSGNVRYKINPFTSVRVNLNYGKGQGSDVDSRNVRGRSYKLSLYEFSGQYEYYFLKEDKRYRSAAIYSKRGMINNYNSFSAYVYAGLGATLTSSTHADAEVFPIDDYRPGINIAPVLLGGIGLKYIIDDRTYINGDLGYRYGLNDYLEGYKQTQSSKFNDLYYYLSISFNYRLKTSRRNIPEFLDRRSNHYYRR